MKSCDIISVHAPLNDATKGLVGARELGLMKSSGVILNLGRGGIIDEEALADALEKNIIAGAATDVLTKEPIPVGNPLLRIKDSNRLVITPHIAWATAEARQRCAEEVYLNIEAWMRGEERNICR